MDNQLTKSPENSLVAKHNSTQTLLGRGLAQLKNVSLDARYRKARDVYNKIRIYRCCGIYLQPKYLEIGRESDFLLFKSRLKQYISIYQEFNDLADVGYGKAYYPLMIMHQNSIGVERDWGTERETEKHILLFSKAYDWLSNNSHLNDPEIWSDLGEIKRDDHWLIKAAEQGFPDAQYLLSVSYKGQKDFKKAVYWCTLAAEQGNAGAQEMLSDIYDSGNGVEQDFEKSVFWYRQLAEQGCTTNYASPEKYLNRLYSKGIYIEKDSDQPIYWMTKAIEYGRLDWCFDLAHMYKKIKNYEKAINWFEKAAEFHELDDVDVNGYKSHVGFAQFQLAELYENGLGIEPNLNKAFSLYVKSADNGSLFAINKLGDIFKDGLLGLEKDYNKAIYWYKKAVEPLSDYYVDHAEYGWGHAEYGWGHAEYGWGHAEYGWGHAEYGLGTMYEKGLGVPKDLKKAFDLIIEAAGANQNIKAMVKVGWMYENGQGIDKDYEMAIIWYLSAAKQGDVDAQTNLDRMYEEGKWVDGY